MDSGRLEAVPPGTVHLDTVRALHQTVVSLRTALETSKNELKELKEKYQQHSHCIEYADIIEKLTLENHILRRKIIDTDYKDDSNAQNIRLEVTYSPHSENIEDLSSEVLIKTATTDLLSTAECEDQEHTADNRFCSTERLHEIIEQAESPELNISSELTQEEEQSQSESPDQNSNVEISPKDTENSEAEDLKSQVTCFTQSEEYPASYKTKLELLSKFDVRIKVRTLKEGTVISSTTSDTDSTSTEAKKDKRKESKDSNIEFEETRHHFENTEDPKGNKISLKTFSTENIKMAVPNEAEAKSKVDKFDVQVRITSEENLVVKENLERKRRKDTLNLDVDDLSLRSLSEGDNSVFSETGLTPADPSLTGDDKEQDNASDNESEEVDDIELIFTTDESKDMSNLQEDLVSIQETEQWAPSSASTHSTPVLIKFHTLDPDFQPGGETVDNAENENQENSSLQGNIAESTFKKRVSLPSDRDIRQHIAFNGKSLDLPGRGILKSYDNKSDNMLYKRSPNTSTRRLDSVDSLTCEYNRGLSFDNTKSSSFELGSSMDILSREDSVDNMRRAAHLGHRFSVFTTDISKCGISEDDLSGNLNIRRNTCPNPFQYRPGVRGGVSRATGPLKAPSVGVGRLRPVLRDTCTPRRESGAQTDVSALPPRWSSDGYLAYKMSVPCATVPTLPQRCSDAMTSRRLTVPAARPPPPAARTDETRRVMLSDIGFTSMVPELSRSADPVWALSKRATRTDSSPVSTSTSKFLSRGSSYRSPCPSMDRSNDWIPQNTYAHTHRGAESRAWRSSLPDVRRDDTEELLEEAEIFVRRSIDNLRYTSIDLDRPAAGACAAQLGQPYIPAEPKHLRLGHTVKVITPQGRVAVGRVRYVGIAGGNAANSGVVVGAEFPCAVLGGLARNDGTHRGRRYFLASTHCTALFVPFCKVVMAWAN